MRALRACLIGAMIMAGASCAWWGPAFLIPEFTSAEPYWPETPPEFGVAVAQNPGGMPWSSPISGSVQRLTWRDVTDCPARFLGDPFLFRHDGKWFLFVEVLNAETAQGDIAVATSADAQSWQYEGIVLDEPFHLSYPCVFTWQGRIYMVPESAHAGSVLLYEATDFPRGWKRRGNLINQGLKDPTLLRHEGRWWMFASGPWNRTLHLYHSDHLETGWESHPLSPVIRNDGNTSRCGGPVFEASGDLYRVAQDCDPTYGNQVRIFEIDVLTTNRFHETEAPESPILKAGDFPWASAGMHQLSAEPLDSETHRWLLAFDGYQPAQPDTMLQVRFSGKNTLSGISVRPQVLTPSSACMVRLFWLKPPLSERRRRMAAFVHFRHSGHTVFQADHELVPYKRMFETVADVPPDAPPGPYVIVCGLYDPVSGTRIPREDNSSDSATLPFAVTVAPVQ